MKALPAGPGRILVCLLCLLSICGISCKKFLASYSQNNSFIETADDLDELLVGEAYYYNLNGTPDMLFAMDDDTDMKPPEGNLNSPFPGFHHWQPNPWVSDDGSIATTDGYYTDIYKRIACVNTILHNISLLKDKGESAGKLSRIAGEAHFLRAYYYFMLANLYGKPYKPASASNDLSVPLKTDPAIKDQFAARSTIGQVYGQLLTDLLNAEKELNGFNQSSTIRANQAAVRSLLSRIYLFMENYEQAAIYAGKVIDEKQHQLTDLNNHTAGKDFIKRNSPEVVFTMGVCFLAHIMRTPYERYKVSNDLAMSFSTKDLRREIFFDTDSKGDLRLAKKIESTNFTNEDASDRFLLRLAEQYLNKAEALAAMDRFEEARTALQELRKKRFKPADLTPITTTGAALVQEIREERRRELCFETQRWFDLRRYGVNTKYPFSKAIRHRSIVYAGNGFIDNGYYELSPYDQDQAAYIVPIAIDEIEFNNGSLTNEPRPVRPLKQ